jgi:pSer/pThr/pTyr-binding forkhead associated (FHA) protein
VNEIDPIFLEIDRLIRLSRLKEIEFIMSMDVSERVHGMTAALERLGPGEYLLGTGPSTIGIIPLNARDVVLGRPPTTIEEPARDLADYCAVDTLYFVPREISRTHAKVVRQTGGFGVRHVLLDLNSTCGTFVNETPVDPNGAGVVLAHGDSISLGPSQTSTYIYYRVKSLGFHDGGVDEARGPRARLQWSRPVE